MKSIHISLEKDYPMKKQKNEVYHCKYLNMVSSSLENSQESIRQQDIPGRKSHSKFTTQNNDNDTDLIEYQWLKCKSKVMQNIKEPDMNDCCGSIIKSKKLGTTYQIINVSSDRRSNCKKQLLHKITKSNDTVFTKNNVTIKRRRQRLDYTQPLQAQSDITEYKIMKYFKYLSQNSLQSNSLKKTTENNCLECKTSCKKLRKHEDNPWSSMFGAIFRSFEQYQNKIIKNENKTPYKGTEEKLTYYKPLNASKLQICNLASTNEEMKHPYIYKILSTNCNNTSSKEEERTNTTSTIKKSNKIMNRSLTKCKLSLGETTSDEYKCRKEVLQRKFISSNSSPQKQIRNGIFVTHIKSSVSLIAINNGHIDKPILTHESTSKDSFENSENTISSKYHNYERDVIGRTNMGQTWLCKQYDEKEIHGQKKIHNVKDLSEDQRRTKHYSKEKRYIDAPFEETAYASVLNSKGITSYRIEPQELNSKICLIDQFHNSLESSRRRLYGKSKKLYKSTSATHLSASSCHKTNDDIKLKNDKNINLMENMQVYFTLNVKKNSTAKNGANNQKKGDGVSFSKKRNELVAYKDKFQEGQEVYEKPIQEKKKGAQTKNSTKKKKSQVALCNCAETIPKKGVRSNDCKCPVATEIKKEIKRQSEREKLPEPAEKIIIPRPRPNSLKEGSTKASTKGSIKGTKKQKKKQDKKSPKAVPKPKTKPPKTAPRRKSALGQMLSRLSTARSQSKKKSFHEQDEKENKKNQYVALQSSYSFHLKLIRDVDQYIDPEEVAAQKEKILCQRPVRGRRRVCCPDCVCLGRMRKKPCKKSKKLREKSKDGKSCCMTCDCTGIAGHDQVDEVDSRRKKRKSTCIILPKVYKFERYEKERYERESIEQDTKEKKKVFFSIDEKDTKKTKEIDDNVYHEVKKEQMSKIRSVMCKCESLKNKMVGNTKCKCKSSNIPSKKSSKIKTPSGQTSKCKCKISKSLSKIVSKSKCKCEKSDFTCKCKTKCKCKAPKPKIQPKNSSHCPCHAKESISEIISKCKCKAYAKAHTRKSSKTDDCECVSHAKTKANEKPETKTRQCKCNAASVVNSLKSCLCALDFQRKDVRANGLQNDQRKRSGGKNAPSTGARSYRTFFCTMELQRNTSAKTFKRSTPVAIYNSKSFEKVSINTRNCPSVENSLKRCICTFNLDLKDNKIETKARFPAKPSTNQYMETQSNFIESPNYSEYFGKKHSNASSGNTMYTCYTNDTGLNLMKESQPCNNSLTIYSKRENKAGYKHQVNDSSISAANSTNQINKNSNSMHQKTSRNEDNSFAMSIARIRSKLHQREQINKNPVKVFYVTHKQFFGSDDGVRHNEQQRKSSSSSSSSQTSDETRKKRKATKDKVCRGHRLRECVSKICLWNECPHDCTKNGSKLSSILMKKSSVPLLHIPFITKKRKKKIDDDPVEILMPYSPKKFKKYISHTEMVKRRRYYLNKLSRIWKSTNDISQSIRKVKTSQTFEDINVDMQTYNDFFFPPIPENPRRCVVMNANVILDNQKIGFNTKLKSEESNKINGFKSFVKKVHLNVRHIGLRNKKRKKKCIEIVLSGMKKRFNFKDVVPKPYTESADLLKEFDSKREAFTPQ